MNLWDDVLGRVEAKVNRHSFYTWFKPTAFVADQGSTVVVRVPDPLFRDWLTRHYASLVNEALEELQRPGVRVTYITDASEEKLASVQAVEAVPRPATTNQWRRPRTRRRRTRRRPSPIRGWPTTAARPRA